MNIYYNAEYTGAHEEAHLVSMGFIAENGEGLYLEFADVPPYSVNNYVREHIFTDTYLYDTEFADAEVAIDVAGRDCHDREQTFKVVTVSTAGQTISEWFKELLKEGKPGECIQLVSYCCHYDASLFYNLFRGVIPEYINLICYDIVGPVMHYVTDWNLDLSLSERLRNTLKDNHMEELAQNLGHPVRKYGKDSSIKYAEIIKNVYEGLREFGKF